MENRNDKSNDFENPVGPEQPYVRLDVPLWQVYVALFLIALVLTAFKFYERRYLAPNRAVLWNSLDLTEFRQERLHRRNILIWVHADDVDANQTTRQLFEQPAVRSLVYLNRCLTWQIDRRDQSEEMSEWISKNLGQIANGGLAFWAASDKQPKWLPAHRHTIDSLTGLIEGE